jgi:hypothetical protein
MINIFLPLQLKYRVSYCPYYYINDHIGEYVC